MNSSSVQLGRFSSAILGVLLICAFVLSQSALAQAQDPAAPLWVPGEFIVKFNTEKLQQLRHVLPGLDKLTDEDLKDALTDSLGAERRDELPLIEADAIKVIAGEELNIQAAVDLIDTELVDYISPNFVHTASKTPNDPGYSNLWGMNQGNDVDINAPEAWEVTTGDPANEIIVGVVDTGVDYTHPDLAANMWTNPGELNGAPGVDDDGNGVVDDIYGYNAVSDNGNPMDDNNHGTHCSGTIGGTGNNGVGVVGVAWKVKIMALKFLAANGQGSDYGAIKAINYAVAMRNRGGKLKVLSNSWGGSGYNPAMLAAIQAANSAGILFVAAAGNNNSNNDSAPNYPSNYESPNVLTVAALDTNGTRASFSNYGATTVDVAAPGVNISSSVRGGGYSSMSGTSMATPHVSGVAALMYGRFPQYSPADAKAQIMASVKPIGVLNGLMVSPGIVNALAAIADPSNFPPDLINIPNQTLDPDTRVKNIPLLAYDRENTPLTYTATVNLPAALSAAAAADTQYNITAYLPQYDNAYGLGEKRFTTAANQIFILFRDGTLYEVLYPYYYYRVSLDSLFWSSPDLLVNASTASVSNIATVTPVSGSPYELNMKSAQGYTGNFSVSVSVSDGNRTDTEYFTVTVERPSSCS